MIAASVRALSRRPGVAVLLVAAAVSVVAWWITFRAGAVMLYSDAISHLNIARLVFDGRQDGLAQLGTVWLPLSHVLDLGLVWQTTLWKTAIAGSVVSMVAFVGGAFAVYRLVALLGGRRIPAVVALLVYLTNLNLLYLQSTPMTEPTYIALFLLGLYQLARYLRFGSTGALIGAGAFAGLGALDRYDGWFVAAVMAGVVVVNELRVSRRTPAEAAGAAMLFAFPALTAMAIWFGWNWLLFGDPLYAFLGPYSAHAQQAALESSAGLFDKGQMFGSMRTYATVAVVDVGYIVTGLGAAGWLAFVLANDRYRLTARLLLAVSAGSVLVFNVLALFLGFSVVEFPGLHSAFGDAMFNVRYGVLALPVAAIGTGLLAGFRRFAPWPLVVAVLLQLAVTAHTGIGSVEDPAQSIAHADTAEISRELSRDVRPGQVVMMSFASRNPVAYNSGLELRAFLQEGVSSQWKPAVKTPSAYADFVVMGNRSNPDTLYESFVVARNPDFNTHYRLVFAGRSTSIYERTACTALPRTGPEHPATATCTAAGGATGSGTR